MKKQQFDEKQRACIKEYGTLPTFSSFLPGIAGEKGIPLWCYYNNRGQAVCSFGICDKDHSIMEFSPAHVAYQTVQRTGFRTFIKLEDTVIEPFADGAGTMHIGPNELEITWENECLDVRVLYYTLPEERVGALVRTVRIINKTNRALSLEVLDGMAALVPYGVNQDALKNMTQLAKAWMQVEDVESGKAFFRVRASMEDTATVTAVEGGNFWLAKDETGADLPMLVCPELVFGRDTSFAQPLHFARNSLAALCAQTQVTQNLFPCAFCAASFSLQPGKEKTLYAVYGQAKNKALFHAFAQRVQRTGFFEEKYARTVALTRGLCSAIDTKTADPVFDAYCKQTYLDNVLRGGTPKVFSHGENSTTLYLYSRKHGDPEREYNYFRMMPEYYSQGNGNFRDVSQNRRCDVAFAPQIGEANIRLFYSLVQSDGYNPLVVTQTTFFAKNVQMLLQSVAAQSREEAKTLFAQPFTPGAFAMALETWELVPGADKNEFFAQVIACAASEPNADFGEGYWTDHWTYSLDLIEQYLSVYPERRAALLQTCAYPWYETKAILLPRARRYVQTEKGLRQYHYLDEKAKHGTTNTWMCTQYGRGETAQSTLLEKIVFLCVIKFATLDAKGMGVEMEGGKPGWYDALNGLPGLLGSSVAESCELARLLHFTCGQIKALGCEVALFSEMANLLCEVWETMQRTQRATMARWNEINDRKEAYRAATAFGVAGNKKGMPAAQLAVVLQQMAQEVNAGIADAVALAGGICPTYFWYEAEETVAVNGGVLPTTLTPYCMPLFLEGAVRWLKLPHPTAQKKALVQRVRASALYDEALHMYKVNESLQGVSFEVGRAKAFTPGWLENESVWLHMEYKYLLELLKSGLYPEFAQAFHDAAIPFLNPGQYGRSTLENVSFLASSANPDKNLHGRGFVARLSGSTAEFLEIWQRMFIGAAPFFCNEQGVLCLQFAPFIPSYLMPESGKIGATFLGDIALTYCARGMRQLVPGAYAVTSCTLSKPNGQSQVVQGTVLCGEVAEQVRSKAFCSIVVEIAPVL